MAHESEAWLWPWPPASPGTPTPPSLQSGTAWISRGAWAHARTYSPLGLRLKLDWSGSGMAQSWHSYRDRRLSSLGRALSHLVL
ncbi:hypothetical protein RIF29_04845 [Crotalaria pallida]|uniref:Uncharacterized protein n=1 Tax=Crotalaria pallida TaxID=3830 RepID=A0AAN9J2G8_CROPI